jgi:hypothetical protein
MNEEPMDVDTEAVDRFLAGARKVLLNVWKVFWLLVGGLARGTDWFAGRMLDLVRKAGEKGP